MPTYSVDPKIFQLFPAFCRGVVVATNVDNTAPNPELAQLIIEASQAPAEEPAAISVWNDTYLKLGVDPKKFTPSIKFLYEQIRKGKPPRSISKIVDIMNLVSLRRMAPCGGDDLATILPGDIHLGFAQGDETFAPLFKATTFDNPVAGEVIYYTPQTKKVMCRRWTWRNADFSKITAETTSVAINIDIMAPPILRKRCRFRPRRNGTAFRKILRRQNRVPQVDRRHPQFCLLTISFHVGQGPEPISSTTVQYARPPVIAPRRVRGKIKHP